MSPTNSTEIAMNTLNNGPCIGGHAWRNIRCWFRVGEYLCAKCGFFGFKRDNAIVQSKAHIECAWFESNEIVFDLDMPDVLTVSLDGLKYYTSMAEPELDYRISQFERGTRMYRFHERNKWHTSLGILPQDRSRNLRVEAGS